MSHVNISIPSRSDMEDLLYRLQLEEQVKFWKEQALRQRSEIENIRQAVIDHGYCYLQTTNQDDFYLIERPSNDEIVNTKKFREAAEALSSVISSKLIDVADADDGMVVSLSDIEEPLSKLEAMMDWMIRNEERKLRKQQE